MSASSGSVAVVRCADGTIGFYRSFTSDAKGDPTPEQAVAREVAHAAGAIARHLKPPPKWQVAHADNEATFRAADVSLHVIRLRSGGWIVDSGQYCR
jgi:hypothetical protein